MSNEKHETIADIVREMRTLGQLDEESTDKIPRSLQALGLRTYADRIEAACKEKVADCNRLDNVAEMREALEQAQRVLHCAIVAEMLKGDDAQEALNAVTAALSAHPRNCDRCSNANEALEAFEKEKRETIIEFIRWLFAEVQGGAK